MRDLAVLVDGDERAILGVDRRVGRCDDVVLLLVGGHPVDLVGGLAVDDPAVRGLDEAVTVHVRVERERADEADVGTLGRLDRAHAAVVRVVDVADGRRHVGAAARARLVAGKAARAEGREATLVREAGKRVGLVHELRELRGAEELLDGRHDRTDVDEALRRDVVDVLGGHALTYDALHAAHADAELVGNELAHRADATVAEVVDVVGLLGGVAGVEGQQVAQRRDDVLGREHGLGVFDVEAKLLVDLVATHLGEVVALGVEVQAVEEAAGGVDRGRLAGALTLVDLDEGVLARLGDVTLERGAHDVGVTEQGDDLVVALGDAEGAEQQRGALATLAVDGDDELATLVDLELEPGTAGGDELHAMNLHAVVHLGGEVHARRADKLRHHDALGAVDDEGAALGHEREVAHEDELLLDLARLLVDEANVDQKRGLIGDVLGTALAHGVSGVTKLVLAEGDLHGAGAVLDGRGLGKRLGKALGHETLERFLLDGDEVGELHRGRDLGEANAIGLLCGGGSRLSGTHQAIPPSTWHRAAVVAI